ncbi:MAG: hypothetical protein HC802_14145 [Caldilineaceae bacterium]|nr:hypothetical protein [Caldilineaceae bacterium]
MDDDRRGLISIALGLVLLSNPTNSVELLLRVVGIAGIIAGIVSIIGGFRLRLHGG